MCDYIADCVQNSVEAGASCVRLSLRTDSDWVEVVVEDNGKGMDAETLRRAQDPFFSEAGKHDHRKVGLGLPLMQQAADALGGSLTVTSEPGRGTKVVFRYSAKHVDAPPLGSFPAVVVGLMTLSGDFDLQVSRTADGQEYEVSRSDLAEALGDLARVSNLALAKEFLESQEAALTGAE